MLIVRLVGAPDPAKRVVLVTVPVLDEASHSLLLRAERNKVALLEDATLQDGKPDFHLVHPRRVFGCVHETKTVAVSPIEGMPSLVLLS